MSDFNICCRLLCQREFEVVIVGGNDKERKRFQTSKKKEIALVSSKLAYISPSDVVTPFSRSLIPLLRDISVYLSVVLYSFLRNSVFVHFDHKGLVSLF